MIHVSKVVHNAVAHHTLLLEIVSRPSRLMDVSLVFNAINFHFFYVNFFSGIAVTKCFVVAVMQRIAVFKWPVLWRTLFFAFLLGELLIGTKGDKVRIESTMLSYGLSKWFISV